MARYRKETNRRDDQSEVSDERGQHSKGSDASEPREDGRNRSKSKSVSDTKGSRQGDADVLRGLIMSTKLLSFSAGSCLGKANLSC